MEERQRYIEPTAVISAQSVAAATSPTGVSAPPPANRAARPEGADEHHLRLAAGALAHTLEAIVIFDAQWRIVFVNRAFTRITGYAADEVAGKTPECLHDGSQDAGVYEDMWRTLNATGQWRGELWRKRKNGEAFPALQSFAAVRGEHGEITHYVHIFNDISQYKDYERRLAFLAHRDPVTHLPNRTLFESRCEHALAVARRQRQRVGILFIDLDHFKAVNDSFGHHTGDLLLQLVAERLSAQLRETDTVARFGGDEFTVLLENLTDADGAARTAAKLLDALQAPFICAHRPLHIAASIGISCYPDDGHDGAALLRRADAAMYEAKRNGRRCYRATACGTRSGGDDADLAAALREALARNALALRCRPIACLADAAPAGAQAVAQWRHPQRGRIGPDRLSRIAEKAGLAADLDIWMLTAACELLECRQRGAQAPGLVISLSARTLHEPNAVERMRAVIARSGIDASAMTLAVPESALCGDPAHVRRFFSQLRRLGPALAIDRFGSGHVPLRLLAALPLHALHIDSRLLRDLPRNARVLDGIIALARALGLTTMATGINTPERCRLLAALGCDHGQGRLFGAAAGPTRARAGSNRSRLHAPRARRCHPNTG